MKIKTVKVISLTFSRFDAIKHIFIFFVLLFGFQITMGQNNEAQNDTLSKFDKFNKKAEAFFKVFPVPIISYKQEAGTILGLAKFNAFHPVKKDTISFPSKISIRFAPRLSTSGLLCRIGFLLVGRFLSFPPLPILCIILSISMSH